MQGRSHERHEINDMENVEHDGGRWDGIEKMTTSTVMGHSSRGRETLAMTMAQHPTAVQGSKGSMMSRWKSSSSALAVGKLATSLVKTQNRA